MKRTSDSYDPEKADRIAYLIAGHLQGTLSPSEQEELDNWIVESDENLELFEKLTDEDHIEFAMQRYRAMEAQKADDLDSLKETLGLKPKKNFWSRLGPYLVAASLILIALSSYLLFTNKSEKTIATVPANGDAPAPGNQAVLTLSDGRTLILGSAANGLLAEEQGTKVIQPASGEIAYETAGAATAGYHTLSVPRGGQYKVILPDGSLVWLNAESALRFPATFSGHAREVELRGEAYFEVAKDAARPFTVAINAPEGPAGTVTVLGTRFNINAYADNGTVSTTLLEGSVRVQKEEATTILKPGQQAVVGAGITVIPADEAGAIAWKEGRFLFRDATVHTIGEQIKRWYDVEIEYEGTVTQRFNTEVARSTPLPRLLDALEGTGQVHFTLRGKKLLIRP